MHLALCRGAANRLRTRGGAPPANLLLALRSLDLDHPQLVDGVRFETRGFDDAFPIEGSAVSRFDVSGRGWVNEPDVIDVNGGTPDCFLGDDGCRTGEARGVTPVEYKDFLKAG